MKTALLCHQEIAFLFKLNFGINRLNIFHHLNAIGGRFYQKHESFGIIQEVDEDVTCIMTPDIPQLVGIFTNEASVPPIEDLIGLYTEENYRRINSLTRNKYSARNFIPIPPFMLFKINEAILDYEGDSIQVLLAAVNVIKEFDHSMDTINVEDFRKGY